MMGFRLQNSMLMVVDVQHRILMTDRLEIELPVQAALDNVARLIGETRDTQAMPILHMANILAPPQSILRYDQQDPYIEALGFSPACAPQGHEGLALKNNYSGFTNPGLELHLQAFKSTDLYLVGFHTSACVEETAKDAMQKGYNVCVVEGATYSRSAERTAQGLNHMRDRGVQIIDVEDFRKIIWPKNPIKLSPGNPHYVEPEKKNPDRPIIKTASGACTPV